MTTLPEPTILDLAHEALIDYLRLLDNVVVHDGEPVDPAKDVNGHVLPHVAVYDGGGQAAPAARLVAYQADVVWIPQITCVAGYPRQCQLLVGRVRRHMVGWFPVIEGQAIQALTEQVGPDMAIDRRPKPSRYYQPLLYRSVTNTTP